MGFSRLPLACAAARMRNHSMVMPQVVGTKGGGGPCHATTRCRKGKVGASSAGVHSP
jgi:hypothetical protein